MITQKIKNYILIGLLIIATSGLITLFFSNRSLKSKNDELKLEIKKEKKRLRDSSLVEIKKISEAGIEKYDSLLLVKQKIKYIRYEKYRYVDRTLDNALDILANYSYEGAREKDSTSNNSKKTN